LFVTNIIANIFTSGDRITPSLFYQFLGKNKTEVALDTYTFCEVLGPVEGNKQLRRHWDAWLTEDIVRELALSDHVDTFRLPVGDWSFAPYGPYVGCTDGSVEYIDQLLDWADEYGIKVLFDIHAMKGKLPTQRSPYFRVSLKSLNVRFPKWFR